MLVRFADDAAIMCKDRRQAEAALARYVALLAGLGLEPKAAKTRIVHLTADAEDGVDFLGFHHRLVTVTSRRTGRKFAFLARWPRNEKMQYARDRIRDITSAGRHRQNATARSSAARNSPSPCAARSVFSSARSVPSRVLPAAAAPVMNASATGPSEQNPAARRVKAEARPESIMYVGTCPRGDLNTRSREISPTEEIMRSA